MIHRRRVLTAAIVGFWLASATPGAAEFSMSVDFDGTGFGTLYRGTEPPSPPSSCFGCNRGSLNGNNSGYTRDSSAQARDEALVAFEAQRLREQQAEARRLEEVLRIRNDQSDRAERITKLYDLWARNDGLNDDQLDRQDAARIRIADAMPAFQAEQARSDVVYEKQLRRIAASIRTITVPAPEHYDSLLLLGVGKSMREKGPTHQRNPFTGQPYDGGAFGFASSGTWSDLVLRGIPDHYLQDIDWLSPITRSNLGRLSEGLRVRQVVAHSNGAAIAEVLIRTHRLVGVQELRLLGGDGSLMHLGRLQRLADEYHITVYVYGIKGDPVPLALTGWHLRALGEIASRITSYYANHQPLYEVLALTRRPAAADANLKVQLLDFPERSDPFAVHYYENYAGILNGQRRMGCLVGKNTDSRCLINY